MGDRGEALPRESLEVSEQTEVKFEGVGVGRRERGRALGSRNYLRIAQGSPGA